MDDVDRKILSLLRDDARLPVASIAASVGISRATVKARMARLQASGTISGYTVQLGASQEAAPVRAIAMIEVEGRVTDRVARALQGLPEVRSLYSTNGRWDLVAEVESGSLPEFDAALRAIRLIEGVTLTETNILLAARFRR
ncbi:Lrp/AsnC family transcriptional regulator [Pelagibacterium luteolum]|uniref:DNA-binding transcriptional regulator, Lrp family n=1 Tax=Pelagibacterium luteolum TaxID=440168 RepID=A0A1G7W0R8_9HYPH|nr:Lrp/AsnC family transcriptional regulator [Pelagibacterium luteolum]SDG64730.1 DNA-binding transcriptional regulator, Lrp family [Pelagibacterium luteolum]